MSIVVFDIPGDLLNILNNLGTDHINREVHNKLANLLNNENPDMVKVFEQLLILTDDFLVAICVIKQKLSKGQNNITREFDDFLSIVGTIAIQLDKGSSSTFASHVTPPYSLLAFEKVFQMNQDDHIMDEVKFKCAALLYCLIQKAGFSSFSVASMMLEEIPKNPTFGKLMAPYIPEMENRFVTWKLPPLETRRFLQLLFKSAFEVGQVKIGMKLLRQFIAHHAQRSEWEDTKISCVELLVWELMSPSVGFDELAALPQLTILKGTTVEPFLQLVEVLRKGDLESFRALWLQDKTLFEVHGLQFTKVQKRFALAVIVGMLSDYKQELLLEDVVTALNTSLEEAEELVADAISCGLIDGVLDQTKGKVQVTSAAVRNFQNPQWSQLKSNLLDLKKSWTTDIYNSQPT